MNKNNPGAFFLYYLTTVFGMDEQFVQKVVSETINPTFVSEIGNCKWDKATRVLTMPEDAENVKLEEID